MKTNRADGGTPGYTYERNIGLNVKRLREGRGMSLAGLAKRLSDIGEPMDAKAVSRIEDGTRRVKFNEAVALSKILEVEMDQLTLHPEVAADQALQEAWDRWVAGERAVRAARLKLRELTQNRWDSELLLHELVRAYVADLVREGVYIDVAREIAIAEHMYELTNMSHWFRSWKHAEQENLDAIAASWYSDDE